MIGRIHGTLLERTPSEALVDVGGVGYVLTVSVTTSDQLPPPGSQATLLVHTHVREDAIQLFGFADETERAVFRLLIGVPNVGPKMALAILSALTVAEFREHVVRNNLVALTHIPGVGRKTAERLVIELRDKLAKIEAGVPVEGGHTDAQVRAEAVMALVALGYARPIAETAVRRAAQDAAGSPVTVEHLVKLSLRYAAS